MLTAKGTPDKPIVIKAAGDGEVIFDGNGAHHLFNVMAADYHIFEGLTIRNTDVAFVAGLKDVAGAKGLTVRNCRIENVGIAVITQYAGSKDFYIADNIILGRNDRFRLHGWSFERYASSELKSYIAIKVYGSGHVICHNAIAYFWDAVDVCTHGSPDPGQEAVAIDFYNNDIHLMNDDFIEADGGVHNIRVMRNRGVNAAGNAFSAQPLFGGPAYFIRNIAYHAGAALKFHDAEPAGLIVYQNTFIVENRGLRDTYSNAHFRNNLFLGTDAPDKPIAAFPSATPYSTFDYDGFRPNRGSAAQFLWISPEVAASRPRPLTATDAKAFSSLQAFAQGTGQEYHGIEVDYDAFENLRPPDPTKPEAIYHAVDINFKLRPGSKAVDAGVRLPNVNDDFTGRAPDLGAYELGQPIPIYGPRGTTPKPFYR